MLDGVGGRNFVENQKLPAKIQKDAKIAFVCAVCVARAPARGRVTCSRRSSGKLMPGLRVRDVNTGNEAMEQRCAKRARAGHASEASAEGARGSVRRASGGASPSWREIVVLGAQEKGARCGRATGRSARRHAWRICLESAHSGGSFALHAQVDNLEGANWRQPLAVRPGPLIKCCAARERRGRTPTSAPAPLTPSLVFYVTSGCAPLEPRLAAGRPPGELHVPRALPARLWASCQLHQRPERLGEGAAVADWSDPAGDCRPARSSPPAPLSCCAPAQCGASPGTGRAC